MRRRVCLLLVRDPVLFGEEGELVREFLGLESPAPDVVVPGSRRVRERDEAESETARQLKGKDLNGG